MRAASPPAATAPAASSFPKTEACTTNLVWEGTWKGCKCILLLKAIISFNYCIYLTLNGAHEANAFGNRYEEDSAVVVSKNKTANAQRG